MKGTNKIEMDGDVVQDYFRLVWAFLIGSDCRQEA